MITLQAPYELPATAIYLPSPTFNDKLNIGVEISQKVAIDNTRYTYVKRRERRRFSYTFYIPFEKNLELKMFVDLYLTDNIKLVNHLNETWNVKLTSEPVTHTFKTRSNHCETLLVFEGVRIYASVIEC